MVVNVGVAVWTVMTRFLVLYCGQFWMDIIVPTLMFPLFQLFHVTETETLFYWFVTFLIIGEWQGNSPVIAVFFDLVKIFDSWSFGAKMLIFVSFSFLFPLDSMIVFFVFCWMMIQRIVLHRWFHHHSRLHCSGQMDSVQDILHNNWYQVQILILVSEHNQ